MSVGKIRDISVSLLIDWAEALSRTPILRKVETSSAKLSERLCRFCRVFNLNREAIFGEHGATTYIIWRRFWHVDHLNRQVNTLIFNNLFIPYYPLKKCELKPYLTAPSLV